MFLEVEVCQMDHDPWVENLCPRYIPTESSCQRRSTIPPRGLEWGPVTMRVLEPNGSGLQVAFPVERFGFSLFLVPSGLWKKPFPFSGVSTRDFYVDENTVVKVPMMLQDEQEHWFLEDRRVPCTVLRMDYRGDAVVAFFILPNRGKMNEVEQVLSPGMLMRWNRLLRNR